MTATNGCTRVENCSLWVRGNVVPLVLNYNTPANTFPWQRSGRIVIIDERISLSVCLSVRKHISKTTVHTLTYFCARCLCLWLGPPLAALSGGSIGPKTEFGIKDCLVTSPLGGVRSTVMSMCVYLSARTTRPRDAPEIRTPHFKNLQYKNNLQGHSRSFQSIAVYEYHFLLVTCCYNIFI